MVNKLDLEEVANNGEKLNEFIRTLESILSNNFNKSPHLDVLINNAGQMAYGSGQRTALKAKLWKKITADASSCHTKPSMVSFP